jgi:thymidylate synthase
MLRKDWLQQTLKKLINKPIITTRAGDAKVLIGWHKTFDLDRFPATTSKKLVLSQVAKELYCFINKLEKKEDINKHGLIIWDDNIKAANMDGIGRVYGIQWRDWNKKIDQLRDSINLIKSDKTTRRAIVTAWNPSELNEGCLPPCHILFQLNVVKNTLYLSVYQRSADAFLGLPFDIASYSILARLIQNELNIKNAKLSYYVSNLHLYMNHFDQAKECIDLECHEYPKLKLNDTIDNFHYDNVILEDYKYIKFIKANMNV